MTLDSIKPYVSLSRVSNSPTVVSNVLVGVALADGLCWNITVAILSVAMILLYSSGMVLNDYCDYEVDRIERPNRPLPRGEVSLRSAFLTGLGLLSFGLFLLWRISLVTFFSGTILTVLIVSYNLFHKSNRFAPLLMGLCRVLVYLTAYLAVSNELSTSLLICCALLLLYVIGVSFVAKAEVGVGSFSPFSAVFLFLPVLYFLSLGQGFPLILAVLVFFVWLSFSLIQVWLVGKSEIGLLVERLVAGISLIDAMVLLSLGAGSGAALAFGLFGFTCFMQSRIRGC